MAVDGDGNVYMGGIMDNSSFVVIKLDTELSSGVWAVRDRCSGCFASQCVPVHVLSSLEVPWRLAPLRVDELDSFALVSSPLNHLLVTAPTIGVTVTPEVGLEIRGIPPASRFPLRSHVTLFISLIVRVARRRNRRLVLRC